MPVYRIAELNIEMEPRYRETADRLAPYLTDSAEVDFSVKPDPEGFAAFEERSNFPDRPDMNEGPYLYTLICQRVLSDYDGFFFHSSALEMDGEGYLFTALSGTGKSTHTRNWCRTFGDRVTMINDDKPIIRRIGGKFFVCGTPWMGKSDVGCNMIAPIRAVYVLQRGEENSARKISPGAVFKQLLEATLLPKTRDNMQKLLSLFNDLFSSVPLFLLTCNKDPDSARVAYETVES